MTKAVQARAVTGRGSTQTDQARQLVEGAMDITDVQVIAPAGDKESRHAASCEEALATHSILREHFLPASRRTLR
jgi:hypothetical protein